LELGVSLELGDWKFEASKMGVTPAGSSVTLNALCCQPRLVIL
jgi:hypothetical protein